MDYYHMTSLNNLHSISKKGLIPQSGTNSKLIGDKKIKTFFSSNLTVEETVITSIIEKSEIFLIQ